MTGQPFRYAGYVEARAEVAACVLVFACVALVWSNVVDSAVSVVTCSMLTFLLHVAVSDIIMLLCLRVLSFCCVSSLLCCYELLNRCLQLEFLVGKKRAVFMSLPHASL